MAGETLTAMLAGWAERAPDGVIARERQGRQRSLTVGDLVTGTDPRAAGLAALGAGPDHAVVVWLPNRIEYVEVMAAAARAVAPLIGLNTRYRADELTHVLARSAAAVLVTVDRFGDTDVAAIVAAADLTDDVTIVVIPDGREPDRSWSAVGATVVTWAELARADPPPAPPHPEDLLIAFTTSGTTGLPKLAVHDHAGTVRHARAAAAAFDLRADDRLLLDLPLCGTFGYTALLAAAAADATTLLHERFVPEESAAAFVADGVTHAFGGDDMILRILDTGVLQAATEPLAWRAGGFASFVNAGPLVGARVEAELGVRLSGLYGMSEVFALLTRWPDAMAVAERSRAGGIPVDPAVELRVIDPDTGAELPAGTDGEVCIRGPQVLQHYLGDPAATAKLLAADGWFRSGDLGRLTGDGGFEFLARLGDSLRLRGFLVDPAEIEHRLERHAAVELAQVVGADDPRPGRGQVAVAFVKLRPGTDVTEADLRAHCAAGIADLKVPTRIVTVDEFPSVDGPNGRKIRKTDLRTMAADLLAGSG